MKKFISGNNNVVIIVCAALLAGLAAARADDQDATKVVVTTQVQSDDEARPAPPAVPAPPSAPVPAALPDEPKIVIQTVERVGNGKHSKEVAWLGLAVEESTEALSSQLGLKPGEGLTVHYLAAGSPAAKAGFRKNDVLVELDGQMLVHPMQFRKLVQMHAEGDTIEVTFYRGGKKQTASVKLGKTNWDEADDKEDPAAPDNMDNMNNLQLQLNGLHGQLRGMEESLAHAQLDKAKMNADLKRTMDETRKAIQDAMRRASAERKHLDDADRELEGLAREGVDVDRDATIIVRNKRNSNRTMLQTDESGTYIIEAGAKTHLTARDKVGKLLFDGEIDTPAEREKVPKEVWEKAEPMFNQIAAPDGGKPKKEDAKAGE
jgi:hypothetical protein